MLLKIGIIGLGNIGQDHAYRCHKILNGVELTAVSDVNIQSSKKFLESHNMQKTTLFANSIEMIQSEMVEAVIIASSDFTHQELVMQAMDFGKPIFCEKPLALNQQRCLDIIKKELKYGKRMIQVGFMRSYDLQYQDLKNKIEQKKIGQPLLIHCAHRNPSVPQNYKPDMSITDTAIHEINILRWLLQEEYKSVQIINPRKTKFTSNLQDPQLIILQTQSGIVIDIEIFVNCKYGYDIKCEIVGEQGVAHLAQPTLTKILHKNISYSNVPFNWKERFDSAYNTELQKFINDVKQGYLKNSPSSYDALAASVAADACLKSQKTKLQEKIEIPKISYFDL